MYQAKVTIDRTPEMDSILITDTSTSTETITSKKVTLTDGCGNSIEYNIDDTEIKIPVNDGVYLVEFEAVPQSHTNGSVYIYNTSALVTYKAEDTLLNLMNTLHCGAIDKCALREEICDIICHMQMLEYYYNNQDYKRANLTLDYISTFSSYTNCGC